MNIVKIFLYIIEKNIVLKYIVEIVLYVILNLKIKKNYKNFFKHDKSKFYDKDFFENDKKIKNDQIKFFFIKLKNIERFLRKLHFKKIEDNNIKLFYKYNGNERDKNSNINTEFNIKTEFNINIRIDSKIYKAYKEKVENSYFTYYSSVYSLINDYILKIFFIYFYNYFLKKIDIYKFIDNNYYEKIRRNNYYQKIRTNNYKINKFEYKSN